jgi:hypothetical protein
LKPVPDDARARTHLALDDVAADRGEDAVRELQFTVAWARRDPDLATLHGDAEFERRFPEVADGAWTASERDRQPAAGNSARL